MAIVLGDHLANAAGLFEPQRQNNFLFQIHLDDGIDSLNINLSLEAASLPTESSEEVELNYINVKRYVAGKTVYDTIPLVVKDMVDIGTARALSRWRTKVYNPITDQVGLARDYKKSADIILFAPDGSAERTWELRGVWPISVNWGPLDMTTSDIVKIETTLRYDKAIPNIGAALGISIPLTISGG